MTVTENTEFNGEVYLHPMIAERQREVWISIVALRMMQEHYGNPYFSMKCVSYAEEAEWHKKAEAIAPPVRPAQSSITSALRTEKDHG